MFRAMSAAASGMEAQEMRMSLIANNLANVNTTGFKRVRGEFQDLLYERVASAGVSADGTQGTPSGMQIGQGVRPVATLRQFTVGDLKRTGNSLDLAIEGAGFLQVAMPGGQVGYTRDGSLKIDAEGRLVNAEGYTIEPPLTFPSDTRDILIASDGSVSVTRGSGADAVQVGKLELATFANAAGLDALGHNLYAATSASGEPVLGTPTLDGVGRLSQGFLEMSNVKVVEEMIDLIATQRAYETNSKVIQAADEMLRTSAQLR